MDETVSLKPSRWLNRALCGCYILIFVCSLLSYSSPFFFGLIMLVLILFAIDDYRERIRNIQYLTVPKERPIKLLSLGCEHCYPSCRIYYNRWCMILKLKNNDRQCTVILTPDRFNSTDSYVATRLRLLNRAGADAA